MKRSVFHFSFLCSKKAFSIRQFCTQLLLAIDSTPFVEAVKLPIVLPILKPRPLKILGLRTGILCMYYYYYYDYYYYYAYKESFLYERTSERNANLKYLKMFSSFAMWKQIVDVFNLFLFSR
jgi:hypothetical protein